MDNSEKPKSVQVSPRAMAVLDRLVDELGVVKAEVVSRMLLWMEKQHPDVQRAMLDAKKDAAAEMLRLKMADMGTSGDLPETLEVASQAAKIALDRVIHLAESYKREAADEPPAKSAGKKR